MQTTQAHQIQTQHNQANSLQQSNDTIELNDYRNQSYYLALNQV